MASPKPTTRGRRASGTRRRQRVFVAEMSTTHFSFVAVDDTRDGAFLAMAATFDRHLAQYGDDNRERCMYRTGAMYDEDLWERHDRDIDNDDEPFSVVFGEDLAQWGAWLDEYYGINVQELQLGGGARDGEAI